MPTSTQPRQGEIFVVLTKLLMGWGGRVLLGLVDLSRIPCGTFFREVHPGSEMASQNDQNKAKRERKTFKPWRIVTIRNWDDPTHTSELKNVTVEVNVVPHGNGGAPGLNGPLHGFKDGLSRSCGAGTAPGGFSRRCHKNDTCCHCFLV